MSDVHCPHDRLFKSVMSDPRVARDFFKYYLPKNILSMVDLNTLHLENASFVDQELDLGSSDILYTVKCCNKIAFLYLLCEHQSSVDALMPFRLLQYMIKIWDEYIKKNGKKTKTLPLIIPICFYHGKEPYNASMDIRDIIQAPSAIIDEILFKPFHLVDMHKIEDEKLREQHWAGIMGFVMKHIFARDFLSYVDLFLDMLSKITLIEGEDNTYRFSVTMLRYILNTGEISQPDKFIDEIKTKLPKRIGDEHMTAAEYWRQQGIQLGSQQTLIDMLEVKFGSIPPNCATIVKKANLDQLSSWSKKIIMAENMEQIFEDELMA